MLGRDWGDDVGRRRLFFGGPLLPVFFLPPLRSSGGREELKGRYSNEMEVTVPGTEPRLGLLALISTGCCRENLP